MKQQNCYWYESNDLKKNLIRKYKQIQKKSQLRKSIQPGQILIVLAGKYKGKRVVFLKQLESGLLLVTGPFQINGVPIKRINQSYVKPVEQKIDLSNVKFDNINDDTFKRTQKYKFENGLFQKQQLTEQSQKAINEKKTIQKQLDQQLMQNIKCPVMKKYLRSKFSLKNNDRVHLMKF